MQSVNAVLHQYACIIAVRILCYIDDDNNIIYDFYVIVHASRTYCVTQWSVILKETRRSRGKKDRADLSKLIQEDQRNQTRSWARQS